MKGRALAPQKLQAVRVAASAFLRHTGTLHHVRSSLVSGPIAEMTFCRLANAGVLKVWQLWLLLITFYLQSYLSFELCFCVVIKTVT